MTYTDIEIKEWLLLEYESFREAQIANEAAIYLGLTKRWNEEEISSVSNFEVLKQKEREVIQLELN